MCIRVKQHRESLWISYISSVIKICCREHIAGLDVKIVSTPGHLGCLAVTASSSAVLYCLNVCWAV
jgi:hypothetical protein